MLSRAIKLYINSLSGLSRQIWLLALVTLINRCGTMVIPFLSVYLTTEKGFSMNQAGWMLPLFGLGSVAGAFIGGRLTDQIGFFKVLAGSLFLGGGMFILLGYAEGIWAVSAMVFLTSVVGESYRPGVMSAVAVYSNPENRTRAYSLLRLAINLGWALGPAIGGWLVAYSGSYSGLFWADGLTCMAASVAFVFLLKEKKQPETAAAKPKAKVDWAAPYKDKIYLTFIGLTILGAVAFFQFLNALIVFYKKEWGFGENTIGNLMALNGLIVFMLEMPLVYTIERKMKMLNSISLGTLMYAVGFFLLNFDVGSSLSIAVVSMVILSVGEVFNMPFTNAFAMGRATDETRGAYMGVFSMTYSVALVISPLVGLKVADAYGFNTLWYLIGGLSLLASAGMLLLKKWLEKNALRPAREGALIEASVPQTAE